MLCLRYDGSWRGCCLNIHCAAVHDARSTNGISLIPGVQVRRAWIVAGNVCIVDVLRRVSGCRGDQKLQKEVRTSEKRKQGAGRGERSECFK